MNTAQQPDPTKSREKDLSICYNYEKTGHCPKEEYCQLLHLSTPMSRCLVFHHLYPNPDFFSSFLDNDDDLVIDEDYKLDSFDAFFMDICLELKLFGQVEDMFVAGNFTTHLHGNVYVRFSEVDGAVAAHKALEGRYYAGRVVHSSFIPVEKLSCSLCKEENCIRGSVCNYIHPIPASKHVLMQCFPRGLKTTPTPLRPPRDEYIPDSPYDLQQGRSKFLIKQKTTYA